ncbi:hypothetical protein ACIQVR_31730 [Streptomyces xanthochromogenes]|uniref:hypothetical protein n=1 Tax=Streptomyces xanthochromogenes TaxID=67384 RepID=UPI0037F8834D
MKNYKLVWRDPDTQAVRTSAVNYSHGAAEDARARLQALGAVVRIVEIPVGGDVPEAAVEELRAGNAG